MRTITSCGDFMTQNTKEKIRKVGVMHCFSYRVLKNSLIFIYLRFHVNLSLCPYSSSIAGRNTYLSAINRLEVIVIGYDLVLFTRNTLSGQMKYFSRDLT